MVTVQVTKTIPAKAARTIPATPEKHVPPQPARQELVTEKQCDSCGKGGISERAYLPRCTICNRELCSSCQRLEDYEGDCPIYMCQHCITLRVEHEAAIQKLEDKQEAVHAAWVAKSLKLTEQP